MLEVSMLPLNKPDPEAQREQAKMPGPLKERPAHCKPQDRELMKTLKSDAPKQSADTEGD
jgi:hypothetical protein